MKIRMTSIILPTLNEKANIIPLISLLDEIYHPLEILVIDDNSSDGTGLLVKERMKRMKNVKIVINNPPLGLTLSLQRGIDRAKGKYVIWMDADFSHPPKIIKKMMEYVPLSDIVIGSWFVDGGKDKRTEIAAKFSYLINRFCQFCFGSSPKAYTSGFVLAKRSLFKYFKLSGRYGEYCIDFLVRQKYFGRKIVEVPFQIVSRQHGKTKTAPDIMTFFENGVRYLKMIYSLILYRYARY